MKKLFFPLLTVFLVLLCLCGCAKRNADAWDVEKIIYVWNYGDIYQYEMFVMTPDCWVKHYTLWPDEFDFDLYSGELPPEDGYRLNEYRITKENWNSLVESLKENDFMGLPEEIPCKYPPCDVGYHVVTVNTGSGSHQSGGYSIGLDKGKISKRFLNILHALYLISDAEYEAEANEISGITYSRVRGIFHDERVDETIDETFRITPDCCVMYNATHLTPSGELVSEEEYVYQITRESWNSLVEALEENDFAGLPEEIPCKYPPYDDDIVSVTVGTKFDCYSSWGYLGGLNESEEGKRFLNVLDALDLISGAGHLQSVHLQ